MASNNSKPQPATVVVRRDLAVGAGIGFLSTFPAVLASIVFHIFVIGMLVLLSEPGQAGPPIEKSKEDNTINADPADEAKPNDPFATSDFDPAAQEFDTDINFKVERKAEVSIPGTVNPNEAVGILDGDKNTPPTSLPAPGGFGNKGQGGTIEGLTGNAKSMGELGGYGPRGMPLAGSIYGRSGATKEFALRDGGGTTESEAAVARGLKWIARNQSPDGKWMLDGNFKDKGSANDIAGTAFGLLPLLGAGKTHKASKDNPYDKPIEKALLYLIRRQDKKTGNFGGGMYAHGLATIAICEAYGLTQDPTLRMPAQRAINYIVSAQHDGGGWRYSPGQAGDTSVVGWQIMALKSAQMSGLDVSAVVMRKAQRFIDEVCDENGNEGYGYTGKGSSPTMSAVGLLMRVYLQSWGAKNPRMIKGVEMNLLTTPPGAQKNIYYYYYATQVMHHFGGEDWKKWNAKMRDDLVKSQDKSNGNNDGSWSSEGDAHGSSGGRLMITSLSLCSLEVYYRHLPIYFRDAGAKADMAK